MVIGIRKPLGCRSFLRLTPHLLWSICLLYHHSKLMTVRVDDQIWETSYISPELLSQINKLRKRPDKRDKKYIVWMPSIFFQRWMLKGPSLKSSGLHISVIYCTFWPYDDNIEPKLKKPSFVMLGANTGSKNRFYRYRPKAHPEIWKIVDFLL